MWGWEISHTAAEELYSFGAAAGDAGVGPRVPQIARDPDVYARILIP